MKEFTKLITVGAVPLLPTQILANETTKETDSNIGDDSLADDFGITELCDARDLVLSSLVQFLCEDGRVSGGLDVVAARSSGGNTGIIPPNRR